jgi:hypothetical protein
MPGFVVVTYLAHRISNLGRWERSLLSSCLIQRHVASGAGKLQAGCFAPGPIMRISPRASRWVGGRFSGRLIRTRHQNASASILLAESQLFAGGRRHYSSSGVIFVSTTPPGSVEEPWAVLPRQLPGLDYKRSRKRNYIIRCGIKRARLLPGIKLLGYGAFLQAC